MACGAFAAAGAFATVVAAALVLALGLGACARKGPGSAAAAGGRGGTAYPYSAAAPRVFYATAEGLSELAPRELFADASGEAPLASRAPNASVLSSDGLRIVAAVNGWGVARIETAAGSTGAGAKGELAYRIAGTPLGAAFAGLTTGGAWPLSGGFLIQLFHDPFSEDPMPASHLEPPGPRTGSRLVFFDAAKGEARTPNPLPQGLDPGYELFAFLPSGGRWFAELRKDAAERVDLKFLAIADPLSSAASAGELGRAQFEAALQPKALSGLAGEAGASLRSALKALGAGPWLVRLRAGSGADAWYLSGGRPEEAAPIFAWAEAGGGKTLALRSDGWLAYSDSGGKTSLEALPAPAPGAAFTALAAAGGLAAAAWESGDFPYAASAGLVIAPLPR